MPRSPIPTYRIPDCPQAERQWAATTVAQVPLSGAFDAAARQQLVDWALEGYEVDAYQHSFNLSRLLLHRAPDDLLPAPEVAIPDKWVIWIRTSDPQDEMRWGPHEWATAWRRATAKPASSAPEATAALSLGMVIPAAMPLIHPVPPLLLALLFVIYAAAVVVWRPWRAHTRKAVR